MSRLPARFTQADVNRALKAAKQAGANVAVRIDRAGDIWLVPVDGTPPAPAFEPNRRIALG